MDASLSEKSSPSVSPPVEELFATVEGARMRYLRAGSGPPLVLVHGLMGYSFSWRFAIPALASHATVYAVDVLGAGFSDRPAKLDCRLRSIAARLLLFCEAVGISSLDLLGTSHGGATAMMAASMCLQRADLNVKKLILVAPVNPWSAHGRRLAPFLGSALGSVLFLSTVKRMQWTYPYLLARLFGKVERIPPDSLAGYQAPVGIPGSFEYALRIASHWTEDLRDLGSIIPQLANIPTLLMWGTADPAVYIQSAGKLRKAFKDCKLIAYAGVGHLPYEEVPDKFNASLIEFLTGKRLT